MTEPHHGRRRGILFVMTGASGVGKGTLREAAADALADVVYSISATTRPRREGEVDGVHYHFLDRLAFERRVAHGSMLEHAEYVGDLYGTPAARRRRRPRRAAATSCSRSSSTARGRSSARARTR